VPPTNPQAGIHFVRIPLTNHELACPPGCPELQLPRYQAQGSSGELSAQASSDGRRWIVCLAHRMCSVACS
jgi:hypothetical protein